MRKDASPHVALLERPDAQEHPGGDLVQTGAVGRYLAGKGCRVEVLRQAAPNLAGFDLALIFNLTRPHEAYRQARQAREAGVPFILFPIYWDLEEVLPDLDLGQGGWRRRLARVMPAGLRAAWPHRHRPWGQGQGLGAWRQLFPRLLASQVLDWAQWVCPNSQAEAEHLQERFPNLPPAKLQVIKNGLDAQEIAAVFSPSKPRLRQVLCVGAIGPRKNQLALAQAAQEIYWPVKLVGQTAAGSGHYADLVRKQAPSNLEFLGQSPRGEVLAMMSQSWVHCQPSFLETPGLASMEAAALGCQIVVANTGPVREYFGGLAIYVDPHSPTSIKAALGQAMAKGEPSSSQKQQLREKWDWNKALSPLGRMLGLE